MSHYKGSCHCGEIVFEIETEIKELTTCDCSLCKRKNALMTRVHEDNFTLLSGSDNLVEYQWNTMVAHHYFCGRCGIYTFHKKRSEPDHYGINVQCLDTFDPSTVPTLAMDGVTMSVVGENSRAEWVGPRAD